MAPVPSIFRIFGDDPVRSNDPNGQNHPRALYRRSEDGLSGPAIAGVIVCVIVLLAAGLVAFIKMSSASKPPPHKSRSHHRRHHHQDHQDQQDQYPQHYHRRHHRHRNRGHTPDSRIQNDVPDPWKAWAHARAQRSRRRRKAHVASKRTRRPDNTKERGCGHRHQRHQEGRHSHHRNRRHSHYARPDDLRPIIPVVGQYGFPGPADTPLFEPVQPPHWETAGWRSDEAIVVSGEGQAASDGEGAPIIIDVTRSPFENPQLPYGRRRGGDVDISPDLPIPRPLPVPPPTSRVRNWVRDIPTRFENLRSPSTHHPMIPPKVPPIESVVVVDGIGVGSTEGEETTSRRRKSLDNTQTQKTQKTRKTEKTEKTQNNIIPPEPSRAMSSRVSDEIAPEPHSPPPSSVHNPVIIVDAPSRYYTMEPDPHYPEITAVHGHDPAPSRPSRTPSHHAPHHHHFSPHGHTHQHHYPPVSTAETASPQPPRIPVLRASPARRRPSPGISDWTRNGERHGYIRHRRDPPPQSYAAMGSEEHHYDEGGRAGDSDSDDYISCEGSSDTELGEVRQPQRGLRGRDGDKDAENVVIVQ